MLNAEVAQKKIPARKQFYDAMLRNKWRLPAYKTSLCTVDFMHAVRDKIIWCPRVSKLKANVCTSPPTIEFMVSEISRLIRFQAMNQPALKRQRRLNLSAEIKRKKPDRRWCIDIIHYLTKGEHEIFGKAYRAPPIKRALKLDAYVRNDDQFFDDLPDYGNGNKLGSMRLLLPKNQYAQFKIQQQRFKAQQMREKAEQMQIKFQQKLEMQQAREQLMARMREQHEQANQNQQASRQRRSEPVPAQFNQYVPGLQVPNAQPQHLHQQQAAAPSQQQNAPQPNHQQPGHLNQAAQSVNNQRNVGAPEPPIKSVPTQSNSNSLPAQVSAIQAPSAPSDSKTQPQLAPLSKQSLNLNRDSEQVAHIQKSDTDNSQVKQQLSVPTTSWAAQQPLFGTSQKPQTQNLKPASFFGQTPLPSGPSTFANPFAGSPLFKSNQGNQLQQDSDQHSERHEPHKDIDMDQFERDALAVGSSFDEVGAGSSSDHDQSHDLDQDNQINQSDVRIGPAGALSQKRQAVMQRRMNAGLPVRANVTTTKLPTKKRRY